MQANEKIAIIGAGRVGTALAQALCARDYSVAAVYDLDANRALSCAEQCGNQTRCLPLEEFPDDLTLLFLCVPDDALELAAREVAEKVKISAQTVFAHCSGAKSVDVLAALKNKTIHLTSFHPVQTFPGLPDDRLRLTGIYFGLEGDAVALQKLQQIVLNLQSNYVIVPAGKKTLYHLGCVMASNYFISLVDAAQEIMRETGMTNQQASSILEPLLRTTLENVLNNGTARAATGPIPRGDTSTVQRHLTALLDNKPALLPLYSELGLRLVQVVSALPASNMDKLAQIKNLLSSAKTNSGRNNE